MLLKPYQERALAQLCFFLRQCRSGDFGAAYAATIARIESDDEAKGDGAAAFAKGGYTAVEGLERAAPYCCLRLPTGGGQTLLAAHAVRIAAGATRRASCKDRVGQYGSISVAAVTLT